MIATRLITASAPATAAATLAGLVTSARTMSIWPIPPERLEEKGRLGVALGDAHADAALEQQSRTT